MTASLLWLLWSMDGPRCTVEHQREIARCSEVMQWDALPPGSIDGYRIYRSTLLGPDRWGPWGLVGSTKCSRDYCPTTWAFARDLPMPSRTLVYRYAVKGYRAGKESREMSAPVEYRAAEYWIYAGGRYVGRN